MWASVAKMLLYFKLKTEFASSLMSHTKYLLLCSISSAAVKYHCCIYWLVLRILNSYIPVTWTISNSMVKILKSHWNVIPEKNVKDIMDLPHNEWGSSGYSWCMQTVSASHSHKANSYFWDLMIIFWKLTFNRQNRWTLCNRFPWFRDLLVLFNMTGAIHQQN